MAWYRRTAPGTGFTKATVQAYRVHLVSVGLAASTINVRISAIRRVAAEAADNGLIDPNFASGVGRVKGVKREGGDGITAQSIFETVKKVRAKLAHNGRVALEQIQPSLGHASVQTTGRYLGVRHDLTDAPCDRLG